jgi:hypothetical protein
MKLNLRMNIPARLNISKASGGCSSGFVILALSTAELQPGWRGSVTRFLF